MQRLPDLTVAFLSLAIATAANAQCTPAVQRLINTRKFDAALQQLAPLTGRATPDDKALNCTGRLYLEKGDLDEAVDWLEKAIKANPDAAQHHLWLGNVLRSQFNQANMLTQMRLGMRMKSEFERAVALDGTAVDARGALLQMYAGAPAAAGGDTSKARAEALAIAKLNPMRGHLASATLAETYKDLALAEKELLAAIAIRPDSEVAYASAGAYYRRAERWADAIAMYEKQIKLMPADWPSTRRSNANYYLGLAYKGSGRNDRAKGAFQAAIAINPDNENAKKALAAIP